MKEFQSLFKNSNYRNNPKGTWQHAKNILISKKFNSPLNENGTKFSHLINENNPHSIVGVIETNLEIVYFTKVEINNQYNSRIDVYKIKEEQMVEKIKGNFNFNQPIEGIYFYDYKNRLIVAWCDGVKEDSNTPKILRLDDISFPVTADNILTDNYIKLIELFPSVLSGEVTALTDNGNIDGIFAYATFKYVFEENETVFKSINTYALIREDLGREKNYHQKGLRLEFKDLDYVSFKSIIIGLYIITEDGEQAYESKKIKIEGSEKIINVTSLSNYKTISNEELILPKAFYTKVETITSHKNSILLGNVVQREKVKLQKYVNLLKIKPVTGKTHPSHTSSKFLKKLMPGEVYNILIQFEMNNGNVSDWMTVPNNNKKPEDDLNLENVSGYAWSQNRYSQEFLNLKSFHVVNRGDVNNFGYWENENTVYPNIDEFDSTVDYEGLTIQGGKDYRGEKISFHRVPDHSITYGLWVENLETTIPVFILSKIKKVRFGFQKRTLGNSLVVANGTAVPVRNLVWNDLTNENFNSQDLEIDTVPSTPFSYDNRRVGNNSSVSGFNISGNSFDRILFLNPEFEHFKPKINFNLTQVNSVSFPGNFRPNKWNGNSEGEKYFLNPDDNPLLYKKNKYFFGFYSYDYKLPNNIKTGSINSDGGLYINYSDRFTNYITKQFGKTNLDYSSLENSVKSFLPHADAELLNNTGDELMVDSDLYTSVTDEKLINLPMAVGGQDGSKPFAFANLTLFNIKKDLYDLNAKNIVSSTNTYIRTSSFTGFNIFQFYLGDVDITEIKGNLKYTKTLPSFTDNKLSKYPLSELKINLDNTDNNSLNEFNYKPNLVFTPFIQTYYKVKGIRGSTANLDIDHSDIDTLNTLEYGYDNNLNNNTNKLNDLAGFNAFDYENKFINKFPDVIARSVIAGDESYLLNSLRRFLFNNFYKVGLSKGEIIALRSNGYELYIQLKYELLKAKVKDVISSKGAETYLTEGDVFDRTPVPITLDSKGYIGSEHKFSCKLFKEGYFTIDHKKGNIVLVNGKGYKLLTYLELRNWLYENLEYTENGLIDINDNKIIDNIFNNKGFSIGYDDRFKRLFITKLYPETFTDSFKFTLSIDLDSLKPVCLHDFYPNWYASINNKLFLGKQSVINSENPVIHLMNEGNKGEYFGNKKESYIDIIFNQNSDISKLYQNLEIFTTTLENDKILKNKTISKIVVFNNNQCSEILELDINNKDVIRLAEGKFRVNNFKDIVINPNDPIITKEGSININNLDFNKLWFDKSLFISNFIVVRVIWDNLTNEDIFLNEIKVISQISNR